MLYIVSYIIKILFSLTATYFLLYFQKEKKQLEKYDILKYNFYCIFLLSPIYAISTNVESYILYGLIIAMLFLYVYKNHSNNNNNLYLMSLITAILISSNYIFYTLFGVAFYLFFENNLLDMFEENND
tara:strand:+ start:223 stop:606 length:384 start_codon:yes stop_codon:yes gene_type:complete